MKRFQFPLERMRLWRERQLESEEERLRRLQAEYHSLAAMRERVMAEEHAAREEVMRMPSVTVEQLALIEQWRGYALREVRRLDACLAETLHRIEDQRQSVLEAHRRLECMNRLKQTQLESWRADLDREEEALVNELVIARWSREGGAT